MEQKGDDTGPPSGFISEQKSRPAQASRPHLLLSCYRRHVDRHHPVKLHLCFFPQNCSSKFHATIYICFQLQKRLRVELSPAPIGVKLTTKLPEAYGGPRSPFFSLNQPLSVWVAASRAAVGWPLCRSEARPRRLRST